MSQQGIEEVVHYVGNCFNSDAGFCGDKTNYAQHMERYGRVEQHNQVELSDKDDSSCHCWETQ